MGFSDYFGRFWFAAEPVFGIVMTLVFLGALRNQILYSNPILLERVITFVFSAAISCCIAWGIVDGIFYAWENHALVTRRNLIADYAKDHKQKDESLKLVKEELQDTSVNLLNENDKNRIYEIVINNVGEVEEKERVPLKDDIMTVFLDFCLNFGACIVIILPLILLRNVLDVRELVSAAVLIAIVLMFVIGVWTETRKGLKLKVKKGFTYSALGIIITLLTYFLGG